MFSNFKNFAHLIESCVSPPLAQVFSAASLVPLILLSLLQHNYFYILLYFLFSSKYIYPSHYSITKSWIQLKKIQLWIKLTKYIPSLSINLYFLLISLFYLFYCTSDASLNTCARGDKSLDEGRNSFHLKT